MRYRVTAGAENAPLLYEGDDFKEAVDAYLVGAGTYGVCCISFDDPVSLEDLRQYHKKVTRRKKSNERRKLSH